MPSFTDTLKVNGEDVQMYASVPSGPGPHPAVVMATGITGIDEFHKTFADRLAAEGYLTVAPDLFHRMPQEVLDGPYLGKEPYLSDPDLIADINAAVDFLKGQSSVDNERIGITGFCMGGRVAWLMPAVNPIFKATVPFYGGDMFDTWGPATQTPFELTSDINCPMLFHFGAIDPNPSPEDQQKLDAELTRLGKTHTFYSYPDADHLFMNFTRPDRFRQEASEIAWKRTLDFFAANLSG